MFNCFRRGKEIARQSEATPLVRQERGGSQIRGCIGPHEKEFPNFPRFGPLYSTTENQILKGYKEAAWEHVLKETEGDESKIIEAYLSAIREVEEEAKRTYVDGTVDQYDPDFRWMMLKDGCFLLQLVILLLGGSSVLGYPEDHDIFGRKKIDEKRWLKSIFYVGNQVPLVVLEKLMNQSFFQSSLKQRKWKEPQDLRMKALYHLLLVPFVPSRNSQLPKERPSDLLHGLHSFVIGKKNPTKDNEEDTDIEQGNDEYVDDEKEFQSATEIHQAGIYLWKAKGMGCTNIHFKSYKFFSVLYIPTLTVDHNTEMLFQCLLVYEETQLKSHQREVGAYLKFMSELVRTKEDVRHLCSKGIIKADLVHKHKLLTFLRKLASSESTRNLWHLRLQIYEFSQPDWKKYVKVFSVALFVISVLQTIIAILSFRHDLKNKN